MIYVRNGMSETTTFHAISRELACASMDAHNGSYTRNKAAIKGYCAAYVVGKKYGVDVSGFQLGKICELQDNGNKEPKELRAFIGDIRNAAYGINSHLNRNLGEQEQEFVADAFSIAEGRPAEKPGKEKKQPER